MPRRKEPCIPDAILDQLLAGATMLGASSGTVLGVA